MSINYSDIKKLQQTGLQAANQMAFNFMVWMSRAACNLHKLTTFSKLVHCPEAGGRKKTRLLVSQSTSS